MIYRFGDCEFDTDRRELMRDGTARAVEPQVFAVLVYLIENRARVVSKDDLLEAVWEGRIVSDSALSSRIKAARAAIGDDGRTQALIRTVHKTGFRFVGEVEVAAQVDIAGLEPARTAPPAGIDMTDLPALDLSLPSKPSVAVLPFGVLGDPAQRPVLADGLTRDIITRLGRVRWLFVTGRGSAFRFADQTVGVGEAARLLGVRYIVTGTLQLDGRRVRIHAALTDAVAGSELWAERYDRALDDILVVQDEIASAIVGMLESEIERAEQRRALELPTENLDAWSAYQRGCWHIYRYTAQDYEAAAEYFARAAKLDPTGARPLAGLSFVHWQRVYLSGTDRDAEIAQAVDYAQQSVALDPRDPQAHWALGRALILRGEFGNATVELEAAIDLNPSSVMGLYSMGWALHLTGDPEQSSRFVADAQRVSPYDPMAYAILSVMGLNHELAGRYDQAADLMDRSARQPNAHLHILAHAACANQLAGRQERARSYLPQLFAKRPDYAIRDFFEAFPNLDADYIARQRDALRRLGIPD